MAAVGRCPGTAEDQGGFVGEGREPVTPSGADDMRGEDISALNSSLRKGTEVGRAWVCRALEGCAGQGLMACVKRRKQAMHGPVCAHPRIHLLRARN